MCVFISFNLQIYKKKAKTESLKREKVNECIAVALQMREEGKSLQ